MGLRSRQCCTRLSGRARPGVPLTEREGASPGPHAPGTGSVIRGRRRGWRALARNLPRLADVQEANQCRCPLDATAYRRWWARRLHLHGPSLGPPRRRHAGGGDHRGRAGIYRDSWLAHRLPDALGLISVDRSSRVKHIIAEFGRTGFLIATLPAVRGATVGLARDLACARSLCGHRGPPDRHAGQEAVACRGGHARCQRPA